MPGGRPPSGPKLVDTLEGSAHAKERLEVVLETVAGSMTVAEACEKLAIGETAFRKIRTAALSSALKELEPKQTGRPPKVTSAGGEKALELEERARWLEEELELSRVRQELAAALPVLAQHASNRQATHVRRAEGKKRRRHERRARARGACRSADVAADRPADGPGGGGGDPPGALRAPGAGGGAAPLDDAGRAEAGTTGPTAP
jgi:hypothetical protein